jgi:hypothetical protein
MGHGLQLQAVKRVLPEFGTQHKNKSPERRPGERAIAMHGEGYSMPVGSLLCQADHPAGLHVQSVQLDDLGQEHPAVWERDAGVN